MELLKALAERFNTPDSVSAIRGLLEKNHIEHTRLLESRRQGLLGFLPDLRDRGLGGCRGGADSRVLPSLGLHLESFELLSCGGLGGGLVS